MKMEKAYKVIPFGDHYFQSFTHITTVVP